MHSAIKVVVTVTGCLLGSAAVVGTSQTDQAEQPLKPAAADRWEPWRPLLGTWLGTSEGNPGKGAVRLEVGFVLNERFLKLAGTADYQDGKGGKEHHEDFGFVSFDKGRSQFVFRQFHIEGFVNQYTLTSEPKVDAKIALTSESCENTPPGWKARETYQVEGDILRHTFELAAPDKPFERYTTATLKRQRR
jgi:hypothetical protein